MLPSLLLCNPHVPPPLTPTHTQFAYFCHLNPPAVAQFQTPDPEAGSTNFEEEFLGFVFGIGGMVDLRLRKAGGILQEWRKGGGEGGKAKLV
jgi:hypothetical protein